MSLFGRLMDVPCFNFFVFFVISKFPVMNTNYFYNLKNSIDKI